MNDVTTLAREIGEPGCRALPLVVDVGDAGQFESMVRKPVAEFGRLDILANNAAVGQGAAKVPIHELPEHELPRVLNLKSVGSFLRASGRKSAPRTGPRRENRKFPPCLQRLGPPVRGPTQLQTARYTSRLARS